MIVLELVITIAAMEHASISTLRFIPALTASGQLGQSQDLELHSSLICADLARACPQLCQRLTPGQSS